MNTRLQLGRNGSRQHIIEIFTLILITALIFPCIGSAMNPTAVDSIQNHYSNYPNNIGKNNISDADYEYLSDLAYDTWNCISYFVDPETGIPYDSSTKPGHVGIDKIGFYIASLAVANDLGFINETKASNSVNKTLNILLYESFETWNGSGTIYENYENQNIRMPYTWYVFNDTNDSKTLVPDEEKVVSTYELGNYYACLIVGRNAFPEFNQSFSKLLEGINWTMLYDDKQDLLYANYTIGKGYSENDHCAYLGSESRIASFLGIATGSISPEHWYRLDRSFDKSELSYNYSFYMPGWQGGIFTQYLPGIFIDERRTSMGISANEFMKAQMAYAKGANIDVWGWSPCYPPEGGYIGYDQIVNNLNIVTPHTSVLAVVSDPQNVVNNLRILEERGVRAPFKDASSEEAFEFGFRDSIDLNGNQISNLYLILDQEMIFLTLGNYLNGTIWRLFMNDSISKKGMSLVEDYNGDIICFIEGEDPAAEVSGGISGFMINASNKTCLGAGWGDNEDYATYELSISENTEETQLKIRYSDMFDEQNHVNNIAVYLDDKYIGTLYTEDTGNWDVFKWSDSLYIGSIAKGSHEIRFASEDNEELNCMNLDCFRLFLYFPTTI